MSSKRCPYSMRQSTATKETLSLPIDGEARYEGDGVVALFPHMLNQNGSAHAQLRKSVQSFFTRRAVNEMKPSIEYIIKEVLSELPTGQEIDLVNHFARPIPRIVIGRLLGLDDEDAELLAPIIHKATSDNESLSEEEVLTAFEIAEDAIRHPISLLTAALLELDDSHSAEMLLFLFGAGYETTSIALTNGIMGGFGEDRPIADLWTNDGVAPLKYAMPRVGDEGPFFPRLEGSGLPFGAGQHRCLGALLAQAEIEMGLSMLHKQFEVYIRTAIYDRQSFHLPSPNTLLAILRNK